MNKNLVQQVTATQIRNDIKLIAGDDALGRDLQDAELKK